MVVDDVSQVLHVGFTSGFSESPIYEDSVNRQIRKTAPYVANKEGYFKKTPIKFMAIEIFSQVVYDK